MIDIIGLDERLKNVIIANSAMAIDRDEIKDESDLINDFGFDSVQVMRFLVEVEKEFCIEIRDEDLALEIIGKYGELKRLILETMN